MIERKSDNSIGFTERAITATVITLLVIAYQQLLPIKTNTSTLRLGIELEQLP